MYSFVLSDIKHHLPVEKRPYDLLFFTDPSLNIHSYGALAVLTGVIVGSLGAEVVGEPLELSEADVGMASGSKTSTPRL